jgi:hypothetical protein
MSEYEKQQIRKLIDLLLEGMQNRICKNCTYFSKNICLNLQNALMNGDESISVEENFGCNRFERKENEKRSSFK